jgi:hypothetical protein
VRNRRKSICSNGGAALPGGVRLLLGCSAWRGGLGHGWPEPDPVSEMSEEDVAPWSGVVSATRFHLCFG